MKMLAFATAATLGLACAAHALEVPASPGKAATACEATILHASTLPPGVPCAQPLAMSVIEHKQKTVLHT